MQYSIIKPKVKIQFIILALYLYFLQIRKTKRISAFPVGLVTERPVSTPVVIDGRITDFYDGWVGNRSYPLDMAGFAFSTDLFVEASKKVESQHFPYKTILKVWLIVRVLWLFPTQIRIRRKHYSSC